MKYLKLILNFFRFNRKLREMNQRPVVKNSPCATIVTTASRPDCPCEPMQPVATGEEMDRQLEHFLTSLYDFRYNLLTEETEFRPLGKSGAAFSPIGQRELNTLCMDARASGVSCWDRDLNRYIFSTRIPSYHPLRLFTDELPGWDGTDRLTDLASRVSSLPLWISSFHTWMLAMTAQWMGLNETHANSVAPMLVSREQGYLKSAFCKSLLPPRLRRYYTEKFSLAAQGDGERRLAEMALISLDEFDKYSPMQVPQLKNLMQLAAPNLRKPHQKNYRILPRIASFIGTSNRMDLLTDPTGSRRFICIEVEHKINVEGIDHEQVYAQLKAELQAGAPYWFNTEAEQAIQQHNQAFYRQSLAEEVLLHCFCPADEREEHELISAAEMFRILKRNNPSAMRGASPLQFSQTLTAAGFERKHTKRGNVYLIRRVKEGQAKE